MTQSLRSLRSLTWSVLALVALAAPFPAYGSAREQLDHKIDIELKGASADDVFRSFAEILGSLELQLDPEVAERAVTIQLHQVTVRTVLQAICEGISCKWNLARGDQGEALVVRDVAGAKAPETLESILAKPLDLDLEGAGFGDVAKAMSQILRVPLDLDEPLVERTVTAKFDGKIPGEMLDGLCAQAECVWGFRFLPEGEGAELWIADERNGRAASPGTVPERLDEVVDVHLAGAKGRDVLLSMARLSGLPLVVVASIDAEVTMELDQVPGREALDELCRQLGARWEVRAIPSSENPVIWIEPAAGSSR